MRSTHALFVDGKRQRRHTDAMQFFALKVENPKKTLLQIDTSWKVNYLEFLRCTLFLPAYHMAIWNEASLFQIITKLGKLFLDDSRAIFHPTSRNQNHWNCTESERSSMLIIRVRKFSLLSFNFPGHRVGKHTRLWTFQTFLIFTHTVSETINFRTRDR